MFKIISKNYSSEFFNRINLMDQSTLNRTGKNSFWVIFGQITSLLISTFRTMILARILIPEDFGLIAMALVFLGIANLFKDMGLSLSIIQKNEINHNQVSNLFWCSVVFSLIVAVSVCLIAPLLTIFYHDERIYQITLLLSLNVFFGGLTMVPQSILRRKMNFKVLAFIRIYSILFASIISIIMVQFYNLSYWALVWLLIFQSFFIFIGTWFYAKWFPSKFIRNCGTKSLIKFGLNVTTLNIFSYFSTTVDKLIIGKFFGGYDLGLYSKSFELASMPSNQIRIPLSSVLLSDLSEVQNKLEDFKTRYLNFLSIICFLMIPFSVICSFLSYEIIYLFLGSNWTSAAPIFKFLILGSCLAAIVSTADQVPLSLGFSRRYKNLGIVVNLLKIITQIIIFYFLGILGLSLSQLILFIIIFYPFLCYCFKGTQIRIIDFCKNFFVPFSISITSLLIVITVSKFLIFSNNIFNLVYVMFLYFIIIFILIFILNKFGILNLEFKKIRIFKNEYIKR